MSDGRPTPGAFYRAGYVALSVAVLFFDQWSKGWITRHFDVHQSFTVIEGLFDVTYVRNAGAAFGLFASVDSSLKAIFLNTVALIAFGVVTIYAFRSSVRSVRLQIGLALILGGAVGNLLDRVRFGFVVDFLDFSLGGHHWPAFNVADSAICTGVALLAWDMLTRDHGETDTAGGPPAKDGAA
jgi:signal peptidase II